MPSNMRSIVTGTGSGTGTTVTVATTGAAQPGAGSIILVAVGLSTATNTVTGITDGTGTFTRLTSTTSSGRTLEIWVGYNFGTGTAATSLVVTRSAGTADTVVVAHIIDGYWDATAAPSPTASTANTATSTSADSGSLTPAIGDMLFAAAVWANTSASSARTHTGNSYLFNTSASTGSTRVECGWAQATAAASSKEVWTLSSVEWASRQVMWTPAAAPAASAALPVKGLDTAAADAASAY